MKYYFFKVAVFGFTSPCNKLTAPTEHNRVNVWKCKINSNGKVVNSQLIESDLNSIDEISTKGVYLNLSDCQQLARELSR